MSRLQTKWIADNAVNAAKIRLGNDVFLRGRNAANTADINLFKVNANNLVEFGVEPTFSGVPTTNNSLVNKQYLLDVIAGIRDPKDAVRAATTGNIDLAAPGDSIDGVALVVGNRFLAKNQTDPSENGVYIFQGDTVPATRATDFDDDAEVTQGAAMDVVEGLVNGKKRFLLTTADPIEVGTTPLTFVETPTAQAQVQFKRNVFVLSAGEITDGYVDLTNQAEHQSVIVWPDGGIPQRYASDFTLDNIGPGDVTRLTFAGDLTSQLAATDVLIVNFAHF